MCGISGERRYGRGAPQIDTQLRMIAALRHRGPDGSGCYRDADVALGHARLAIIDAAGGGQPMSSADGRIWISFNGEIFNFVELATQLRELGHEFRTRSDTEVLLHAWQQWGLDCFNRLNGQWAVAIWDTRLRELVLSRDRFGILPLFHTRVGDRVLFASEVGALLTDPDVPREFDPDGLNETFTFWSAIAPRTVFAGIEQVPPGECVIFSDDGRRSHRYFQDDFTESAMDVDAGAAAVRETLIEATRLRFLRSDVPVAAYLSGGIDSAVTAGIISTYTDTDVHTYSLRFADRDFDEGIFQQHVRARLGSAHHEITVSGSDIAAAFPEAVRRAEAPLLRTAPAPMFLLSQAVADGGHRVVVTGEGADEMLAGYDLFREAAVRRFLARDPDSPTRRRALELLYPWMTRSPGRAPAFAHSFFSRNLDPADPFLSHRPRWDSTSALKAMMRADVRDAVTDDPVERLRRSLPKGSDRWHPLAQAQWVETTTLLPGYLLCSQGDRMLMAHSIEGRFPFLDPAFARVAESLPAWHKLHGLDEKHVLKQAFADLVPAEVLARPKQPYRSPDATSFFGGKVPSWVEDMLSADAVAAAGVFRPEVVSRLADKCVRAGDRASGNVDNMRIVAVLSTQLLYHDMISGGRHAVGDPPGPLVVTDTLTTGERR